VNRYVAGHSRKTPEVNSADSPRRDQVGIAISAAPCASAIGKLPCPSVRQPSGAFSRSHRRIVDQDADAIASPPKRHRVEGLAEEYSTTSERTVFATESRHAPTTFERHDLQKQFIIAVERCRDAPSRSTPVTGW